jgi:ABC-type multidrug transport system fused ATPase/permease subunit
MKLDKFLKLKNDLETFSFEKNFNFLSKTLYYFSFLGNIFLVLFSYFFIKDVTNSIPNLFTGQALFFTVFIILFMIGYELFKRFAFEQLTVSILKIKKLNPNIFVGCVACLMLVCGSFYLSLNGAHRLVDTSETVELKLDTLENKVSDSISAIYQKRITLKESQIQAINDNDQNGVLNRSQQNDIKKLEQDIKSYETERDSRIAEFTAKNTSKLDTQKSKIQQNSFAFGIMVFFLEFIILIGVAFSSYYKWTSYSDMKKLLTTPKFKQLETNLNLLKLYYQNGRKKEADPALTQSKMVALVKASKLSVTQSEIFSFIALCSELEIVTGTRKKKVYNVDYEKAKGLLEVNHE